MYQRATTKKKEQNAQHTGETQAQRDTEGVAAVSWIELLMIRRPFGSIDLNSIRETELHKESRRRHSRGERETLHSPQLDRERHAARQRSIDPNSIRQTELHKESRRRHSRGERESLHSPQLDTERDAARQRAAATRREQWTVLSGTSTIGHGLHVADRAQGLTGT